jgi:hypothetical protein
MPNNVIYFEAQTGVIRDQPSAVSSPLVVISNSWRGATAGVGTPGQAYGRRRVRITASPY